MEAGSRLNNLLRMLTAEPADVFLNYALALEYLKDRETFLLAETQLRKVLTIDGGYIPAYYQLGKLLESKGKVHEALEAYRNGLRLAEGKKDRKAANEFGEAIFMLED